MSNLFKVSPSPHVYGKDSIKSLMYGVIIALLPTLAVSLYFFGIGALIVTATAVASAMLFEYIITKFLLKQEPTLNDGSAIITGLLLAFNVPSNLPIWIILIGSLVAIGVGKMSFGGLGNNPFNPALVGRVFLLISFPVQMTSWPKPGTGSIFWFFGNAPKEVVDANTGATPLGVVKDGIRNGEPISKIMDTIPDYFQMFIGDIGGSLGEAAGIAIIIGFIYMLVRKIVTWHIPVVTVGTIGLFAGILWLFSTGGHDFIMSSIGLDLPILHYTNDEDQRIAFQMADPLFHILTGGVLLGAIFMATDYVSTPMTVKGMIIYSVGIGMLTVIIRVFGAYPEGVSFAILIMNAFVPLINMYVKPKRFGEVIKNGK